jgi:hypothetical protein
MDRIDSAEPTLATDSTEPTLPIDNTDPRDPILSNESCDQSDHLEPAFVTAMRSWCQVWAAARAGPGTRPFCAGTGTGGPVQAASSSPMSSAISGIRGLVRRLGSA